LVEGGVFTFAFYEERKQYYALLVGIDTCNKHFSTFSHFSGGVSQFCTLSRKDVIQIAKSSKAQNKSIRYAVAASSICICRG